MTHNNLFMYKHDCVVLFLMIDITYKKLMLVRVSIYNSFQLLCKIHYVVFMLLLMIEI